MNHSPIVWHETIILSTTYRQALSSIIDFLGYHHDLCLKCHFDVALVIVFESSEESQYNHMRNFGCNNNMNLFIPILNRSSRGFPSCLNYGILNTFSEFILRIDTDDRMTSERLYLQISTMRSSKIDISYMDMITKESHILGYPANSLQRYIALAMGTNPIPHPTVCFRRDSLNKLGLYDPALPRCEDFDLWIRAFVANLTIRHLPCVGTTYSLDAAAEKNKDNAKYQLFIRLYYIRQYFLFALALALGLLPNLWRYVLPSQLLLRIRRRF